MDLMRVCCENYNEQYDDDGNGFYPDQCSCICHVNEDEHA